MKTYNDIGLLSNPFVIKQTYDHTDLKRFPFLITNSQLLLKGFLEGIITQQWDDVAGYYVILGERGSGKTTSLLWLDLLIKEKNDEKLISKYERSIKGMGSIQGLASKLLPNKRTIYYENVTTSLKTFLSGKRYFWLIDVPDRTTGKEIDMLTEGLEILLGFRNVSVFIAMNKNHYNKTFEYSEIMGKFTTVNLEPFSFNETQKLIEERLKMVARNDNIKLFTQDAIEKIHVLSKGIPRNILSICDHLIDTLLRTDETIIDLDFVEKIAGEDIARKIIFDRIENEIIRSYLLNLYKYIKEKGDIIEHQENFIKEISSKTGWCRITILKRLKMLQKLGLIEITKSEKDSWTNIIKLVA